jgi:hypothetical protein
MADTGAPWNIPYVEPADLVRAYPAADEAQALAIAAGLSEATQVKQVVHALKDDTFSITSSTYTTVTGLEVTITPTSASSLVLLTYSVALGGLSTTIGRPVQMAVFRDTTNLIVPASPGSRQPTLHSFQMNGLTDAGRGMLSVSGTFRDSPNSTSALTYSIKVAQPAGTGFVNRSETDTDASSFPRSVSWLTATEVSV